MYEYLFFTGVSLAAMLAAGIFIMKYWIKLIGLKSVIDPYAESIKPHKNTKKNTFKILTYNCFLQNLSKIFTCIGSNNINERLDEIIEHVIGDYDIVCLQEVFATSSLNVNYLIQRANELGFKWCVVPKSPDFWSRKIMDSGLVILSKHPILDYECVSFTHKGVFSDQFADKGFQYAKINIYGNIVHVINTHVQSDYEIHDKIACLVKLLQYKQIKKYIDKLQKEDNNDIYLCGDLNCNANYTRNFKIYNSTSYIYMHLTDIYDIRHGNILTKNSDLLFDKTYPDRKYKYFGEPRPATTYSTYNKHGNEIDTIWRSPDDPYLLRNNYVCLPRSVDYIILIRNSKNNYLLSNCKKCKVKNFEYEGTKSLSDHLDVYAKMKFINSKRNNTK